MGLEFRSIPIRDRGVPGPTVGLQISELVQALSVGMHVAIHCRFGIGRSSTLAASVMVDEGESLDKVWSKIARARGTHVLDTDDQRAWVERYAQVRSGPALQRPDDIALERFLRSNASTDSSPR